MPLPVCFIPDDLAQVSEAILKALGVETCGDLLAKRGMIAALFSDISTDFFMEVVRAPLSPVPSELLPAAQVLWRCKCVLP